MSTYRELVYLVLDELKISSDDSFYTEDHVIFLLGKCRGLLLKQQYKDIKKDIPESNFQTICMKVEQVPAISGEICEGGTYLKSTVKIPSLSTIIAPRVYTSDYYQGNISYISRERMRYVGYNKWLQNIIYASIGPDNYLYLKSSNPQYLQIENLKMTGIFEDPEKAAEYSCDGDSSDNCNILDATFPLEEALIPTAIELVIKYLSSGLYKPEDSSNNASDDLSSLAAFIRRNTKSALQKQIEDTGDD